MCVSVCQHKFSSCEFGSLYLKSILIQDNSSLRMSLLYYVSKEQLSCFASPHRSAIWRTILSPMHMWNGELRDTMFGDFEFIRFHMEVFHNNGPGPENSFSARLSFPWFSHRSISFASFLRVVVIRSSCKKTMFRVTKLSHFFRLTSKPERHPCDSEILSSWPAAQTQCFGSVPVTCLQVQTNQTTREAYKNSVLQRGKNQRWSKSDVQAGL